jgi:hypothetical protein
MKIGGLSGWRSIYIFACHSSEQHGIVSKMRGNSEPETKAIKSEGKKENEGQNHQPIEAHAPVPWIEITVNGNK